MGCLFSSGPHPCAPCVWHFSGPGSCHSPSFAFCLSPSCGTCGGRRSPTHYSMAMAERQKGCSSPGNWRWQPCLGGTLWPLSPLPLLGLLSGTPVAFSEMSPRHTFLWVCRAEEEMKACFRHLPHL